LTRSNSRLPWARILRRLESFYSQGEWRVPVLRDRGADPFLVLISTILSHRTRDEVTARATVRLLTIYPTPGELARAPLVKVRRLIDEVGLAESKARGVRAASEQIVSVYRGRVPASEADLMSLPMVGPKTAHAVRVFGHELSGLPVDVHILRVTRRLGAVQGNSLRQAQSELSELVPRKYWKLLNPILVQHGQNLCRAHDPMCSKCPIESWCAYPRGSTAVGSGGTT
jgi:endonuclease III